MLGEEGRFTGDPGLLVGVAIAVVRIEHVVRAAVEVDIGLGHHVQRRDVAGPLLAGEGAVQLVDQLPALQVQRLGHGDRLVGAGADALIGAFGAVARRDVPGAPLPWMPAAASDGAMKS